LTVVPISPSPSVDDGEKLAGLEKVVETEGEEGEDSDAANAGDVADTGNPAEGGEE